MRPFFLLLFLPTVLSAQTFLVDSVYCHEYPSGVQTPQNRTYNLAYTPDGDLLEAVTQHYDAPTTSYANARRELYQRNGNGDPTEQIVQTWDAATSAWTNLERKLFAPTPEGFFEEVTTQDWTGTAWQNRTFEEFDFITGTNRPFRFQILQWDASTQSFRNQAQFIYIYNGNGRLLETRFQLWNATQFAWQDANRTQELYDGAGNNTTSTVSIPGAAANTWTPQSHVVRTFTAEGKLATQTDELFDTVNGGWLPQKRTEWVYGNTAGLETSKTELTWQNGQWIHFFRFLTDYDTEFNQTGFEAELWQNDAWTPTFGCELFYRELVSETRAPVVAQLPCTLPNPLLPGQVCNCDSDTRGEARWYDAQGRLVHTQIVDGQLTAPALESGWYVVHLRKFAGGDFVRRVVVR